MHTHQHQITDILANSVENTDFPREALSKLRLMEKFFEPQDAVMFESDLIADYGQPIVWKAIDDGLLEHRRLPFSGGRERCICWLTPKGRDIADTTSDAD